LSSQRKESEETGKKIVQRGERRESESERER